MSGGRTVATQERGTAAHGTVATPGHLGPLAAFGAITLASALASARYSPAPTQPRQWVEYRLLRKPSFTPPDRAFAIWGPLYVALTWSAYELWKAPPSPHRSRALAYWGGARALDVLWLWLGFGARRRGAMAVASVATLANAAALVDSARKTSPKAAWLAAPYAAWIAFAALLSEELWRRN